MIRKKKYILGIDLGGTKIGAAVVTARGRVEGRVISIPTGARRRAGMIADSIRAAAVLAMDSAGISRGEIRGAGVGSPGPLDPEKGRILTPPNLPALRNYDLGGVLEKKLGLPVRIGNDGNMFTLGEAVFGAGRGHGIVLGVTLGTGIGSGLVIDRRVYNGATGTAGEIWCFPVRDSIADRYLSGYWVSREYARRTGRRADTRDVAARARKGDRKALSLWNSYGENLGEVLAFAVNLVDPGIIVLGGSVSGAYRLFSGRMNKVLRKRISPVPRRHLRVTRGSLGGSAGIIGAAALFLDI